MKTLIHVTVQGVLRDRVFHGILFAACLFLFIPSASSFSMRQVTALAITLSLSLTSFILLLLSVFLGATALWKDLERRYVFTVLTGPISRSTYLLGKYLGIVFFLLAVSVLLGALTSLAVWYSSISYPPNQEIAWASIWLAIVFDAIKYCLLIAVAFFFSTVSTSFFLPLFGTITIFLAGNATQEVFDFLQTPQGRELPVFVSNFAKFLYYLLPNFSAFDLKINAIYSLPLHKMNLVFPPGYAILYIAILLSISAQIFLRKDMR